MAYTCKTRLVRTALGKPHIRQSALGAVLAGLFGFLCAPGLLFGQAEKKLTLDQVQELIQAGTPDTAIAGEIERRGLDFTPSKDTLVMLLRLGAGSKTLSAIDSRIPSKPADIANHAPAIVKDFGLNQVFGAREVIPFRVNQPGKIILEALWEGNSPLALILNGPGQVGFYARRDGQSPLRVEYEVTTQDLTKGEEWQASIVNFSKVGPIQGSLRVTTPQSSPSRPADVPPNFAGTWELFESIHNGVPDTNANGQRVIFTQNGNIVHVGNRDLTITSAGIVTYQMFFAHDDKYGHEVATEDEADLVDTLTWRVEGSILVFETVFDYRRQYFGHPAGKDLRIIRYRRVAP